MRSAAWVVGYAWIISIHTMSPGFPGTVGGGSPEHDSEIAEIPAYIVEPGA